MPDRRRHRGRHPADDLLFAASEHPVLGEAVRDLSWLLGRGYSEVAAVKLVGDRFELRERQRIAVRRSACSDADRDHRAERKLAVNEVGGRALAIDGFNCIVTIEAAMGGGLILLGRDGCRRDLASVHGSYRKVEETAAAVAGIAEALRAAPPSQVVWYLDRPVSNSGRLSDLIRTVGEERGLTWQVELVNNPDRELVSDQSRVVASSDSWVLDRAGAWVNLPARVIRAQVASAWVVDLRGGEH